MDMARLCPPASCFLKRSAAQYVTGNTGALQRQLVHWSNKQASRGAVCLQSRSSCAELQHSRIAPAMGRRIKA